MIAELMTRDAPGVGDSVKSHRNKYKSSSSGSDINLSVSVNFLVWYKAILE